MDIRNKVERFLRDKYSLMFLGVLLIAFVIRLYYFIQTYNQPLWWDEAEYMSMAKNILYGIPFDFNPQRPILFPLLMSLFLWASEGAVRFFIVFLPSLGVVVLTYLLGKELYDKKTGLIAAFIISIFWSILFDSTRIHADVLGLFFSLLGIYLFWKGYVANKSVKLISLGFLFMILAFMVKVNMILALLIVLIFLIITERLDFLKEKILWKSSIWIIFPLIPLSIYNYLKFGTILPFIQGYVDPASLTSKFQSSFNWSILNFTYVYTYKVFFVLFILGALFVLLNLVLGFDLIYKEKNLKLKSGLFSILAVIIVMSYFIFVERWGAEPRWLVLMAPFMFFIIARGILDVVSYIKADKKIAFIAIVFVLFIGAYPHLKYNDELVNVKKTSYEPVKLAGLWIKEHSNKGDLILSKSVTQITYYSERETFGIVSNDEIKSLRPKYLMISIFELHPPELLQRIEEIKDHLQIVNGYFMDAEGKQPALIIYEFKDYDF